jgi:hypothetical protein
MESQQTQTIAEPPGLALYRIGVGHYFSRALALAAKLGVADCLKDGPRHYEDLAKATQTHGPSLNRVMRLLASGGIFEERENGNFALTPLGELLRRVFPVRCDPRSCSSRASVSWIRGRNSNIAFTPESPRFERILPMLRLLHQSNRILSRRRSSTRRWRPLRR